MKIRLIICAKIVPLLAGLLITIPVCYSNHSADNVAVTSENYAPMIWPSQPPADCPFEKSEDIAGIYFTGRHAEYAEDIGADTWYPSWASDGNLYSPYTDGKVRRGDGSIDFSKSWLGKDATTGQAVLTGDDALTLKVTSLGLTTGDATPYQGRYPCGSLVHDGIWYYGTYCLDEIWWKHEGASYNWPFLGAFVGFRISKDFGKTWTDSPCTPADPLFGEKGEHKGGPPVKIGVPHFVDFGKNMEHSPDGKAYLVCHGATENDPKPRPANLSWITADQIYLIRVTPKPENINDRSKYEFFAGHNQKNEPQWTNDFSKIKPLIDWNNNCGCVTMTYNAPLKKYLMCVTDGWPTCKTMNTYILESDKITGPWKLCVYMKNFGEQGYFVNFPSKFISKDGRTAWLCYSSNFTKDQKINPPFGRYGLCLQEVRLLDKLEFQKYDTARKEPK